jgi:D-amino-acid dehydrogenase
VERYEGFVRRAGLDCGWEVRGALNLYTTRHEFDAFSGSAAIIGRYGSMPEPLKGADLRKMEPAASPRVYGAWFDGNCGQVRPEALVTDLGRVLTRRGVQIVENERLTGFQVHGGRARAAITDGGRRSAGAFVVATGAWTPQLSSALGCSLPIQPGKGYALTLPAWKNSPRRPCFFEEARVVATPWAGNLRLGGTMEFAGYDERLNRPRLAALLRAGRDYLQPAPAGAVREEWYGWRPMTPDSLPFIDRAPGMDNVVVAAGHNMAGISLAPITATAVAALVTGEAPPLDLHPYRLGRFVS